MRRSFSVFMILVAFSATVFAQKQNYLSKSSKKKGWTLLFDGETTKGWTTTSGAEVPAGWSVSNGVLTANADGNGGDIVTKTEYSDFELTLDYRVALTSNSGVKYFYTKYANGEELGLEYQILDDALAEDNKQDNHLTGALYDIIEPSKTFKKLNKPGEWNSIKIIAKGQSVEHYLNDYKLVSFSRDSKQFKDAVAASKFSKVSPAFGSVNKGQILLQEHGGEVSFRNIKIKKL
jgi:hypothetical protein